MQIKVPRWENKAKKGNMKHPMWNDAEIVVYDISDLDFETPMDHLKELDDHLREDSAAYSELVSHIFTFTFL